MSFDGILKLQNELSELLNAKDLLDEILRYYDVYGDSFDNDRLKEESELRKKLRKKNPEEFYKNYCKSLNDKIRDYMKFDDSE